MGSRVQRRFLIATVLATMSLMYGVMPATASASPSAVARSTVQITTDQEKEVRAFFDKFDVDAATQDRLLAMHQAGGRWDSLSGKSEPIRIEERKLDDVAWTVSTFADGSISAQSIGPDASDTGRPILSRGVNSCGYSPGSYGNFKNCHIYYWVGLVSAGFYANFSIVAGSNNDRITAVWDGKLNATGSCSQSEPKVAVFKASESSTGKAVAGFTGQATTCVIFQTVNFSTYLYVGGNQAIHVYS